MILLPPITTRTATLFPVPSLFRSLTGLRFRRRHLARRGRRAFVRFQQDRRDDGRGDRLFRRQRRCRGARAQEARRPSAQQGALRRGANPRSEEHTSELQSLMRISYAVFCLKKKTNGQRHTTNQRTSIYYQTL